MRLRHVGLWAQTTRFHGAPNVLHASNAHYMPRRDHAFNWGKALVSLSFEGCPVTSTPRRCTPPTPSHMWNHIRQQTDDFASMHVPFWSDLKQHIHRHTGELPGLPEIIQFTLEGAKWLVG